MKFLIETGSESHTSSYQSCQAKYVGGPNDGKHLYEVKSAIISTEWMKSDRHTRLTSTVYELPEGTEILIDYKGHDGPEKFIIRLDASQEVNEYAIGTSRLRCYTMKGRYTVVRDLIKEAKEQVKRAKSEGF